MKMKLPRALGVLSHVTLAIAAALLGPTACETEGSGVDADAGRSDAAREARVPFSPDDDADSDECTPASSDGAVVPERYAGRASPLPPTKDTIEAGKGSFMQRCASCHGPLGDGAGQDDTFGPAPADLTKVVRAEDYLFWRISAGGSMAPFCSSMPAFGSMLSETVRWELVAYTRSLAQSETGDAGDAATD
jgi:mono/diheme cytochrome c family protein